jgi:hypothetical protein
VSRFWIFALISSLISEGFNCMVSSLGRTKVKGYFRPDLFPGNRWRSQSISVGNFDQTPRVMRLSRSPVTR